jgi:uncharacterized protein
MMIAISNFNQRGDKMYSRMLNFSLGQKSSIFLFGPRGTGKTSWIKASFPDALYLDLLDFSVYNVLSSDPSRLDGLIPRGHDGWVVLDEVQRVPELLNEVHRLIEGRNLKFLLTGSSARSLRKKGVNLLAGRALTYHMHPLVIQELKEDFDLKRALLYGLLPAAVTHSDAKKFLESYVQTYLREEVLQEGLTRNIGAFSRFLEAASYSQGSILNYSEIARELSLNRLMVASYFDILEDLLLAKRIDVFTKRAKRKTVAHQKFYFFDTGVYRVLRPSGLLDTPEEGDGAALETLFFQSLSAINDYLEMGYKIHFWRTLTGVEVDFVLYGPRGLHAFEVKRSSAVTGKSLFGLKSFKTDYPEAKLHLIYLGNLREYHGEVEVIPFEDALRDLHKLIG